MVSLVDATVFLLCFAVAGLHALDYLLAICKHNPAGAVALLAALPTTYFTGVILVYLQTAPARVAPVSPAALKLFAAMSCALLLFAAIIMFMPLAGGVAVEYVSALLVKLWEEKIV